MEEIQNLTPQGNQWHQLRVEDRQKRNKAEIKTKRSMKSWKALMMRNTTTVRIMIMVKKKKVLLSLKLKFRNDF